MRIHLWVLCAVVLGLAHAGFAEFAFEDNGTTLTILEDGAKVLCYNYGRVDPPEGVDRDRYWRSSYIHPLYGLDGEVMTQDFPPDHYHHRGLFWTWPRCRVGDREMDLWTIVGARQLFQQWIAREADEHKAEVAVQNAWLFDDDPEPKVRETVRFTVHPADKDGRCIDFHLVFTNICAERVFIGGQTTDNKGYGGFCFRPNAARKPGAKRKTFTFTTAQGEQKRDALKVDTPWADVAWRDRADGPMCGAAIFQHPKNPGYPHPGWILRHYGFLGASWPHLEGHYLEPDASVELRYQLYTHQGTAEAAKVGERFKSYVDSAR